MEKQYLYRNDGISEGVNDIRKVIIFETVELGNTDIWNYCLQHYGKMMDEKAKKRIEWVINLVDDKRSDALVPIFKDKVEKAADVLVKELDKIVGKELKYCVWLEEYDRIKELYGKPTTKVESGDIILSDLGYDGILYGYCDEPEYINLDDDE